MPYVVVSHGSDTNYMFNGVFPESELSKSDKDLSEPLTRSFINFAHIGDPNSESKSAKRSFYWPAAFDNADGDTADLMPSQFNLLVGGGPYGTRAINLSYSVDEAANERAANDSTGSQDEGRSGTYLGIEKLQQVFGGPLDFGPMESRISLLLKHKIQQEKLFER